MLSYDPPFRFLLLLVMLILLLLMPGVAGSYLSTLLPVSFTLVLVASLYLVAEEKREFIIGCVLAAPPFLTTFQPGLLVEEWRVLMNYGFLSVFLIYVSVHILRYLLQAKKITSDVIFGALSLYLIMGFIWAFAYSFLENLVPGSIGLITDAANAPDHETFAEILYFSFVTITTLGYGDIIPVTRLAQSLAVMEAIAGQIYLAVIIARLVGMHISARR